MSRKINITWAGEKSTINVDMELLQDITDELCNPYLLHQNIYKDSVPDYVLVSKLVALILNKCGRDVDPMSIWDTIKSLDDVQNMEIIIATIIAGLCPDWSANEEKSEAASDEGKS